MNNLIFHKILKEYFIIGYISLKQLYAIVPDDISTRCIKNILYFLHKFNILIIDLEQNTKNNICNDFTDVDKYFHNKMENYDSTRMYLKETGFKPLLSEDGEMIIFERMEKGREKKNVLLNTGIISFKTNMKILRKEL